MRNLLPLTSRTALATAATALAIPPSSSFGLVPGGWTTGDGQVVPEFALEIWADGAATLATLELFGAHLHPLVVADFTVTGSASTDKLTHTAHGLLTGDGPLTIASTGTLPAGLLPATDYWVVGVDANTFKIADSLAHALAGTTIDLTTDGTATITVSDEETTMRVHWHSHGLLGPAGDGALVLTAQKSYLTYRRHYPLAVAYALSADSWSGGTVSAAIIPAKEVG